MVTVPCRTQGNERKVGEMKRNVPPQNGLCISPLATSLPSFSEGWGFQAEEIMCWSYPSWRSSNSVRIGRGKLCAQSSVMIGYQNPSGIKEGIREGRPWSRESLKRQETPTCLCTFVALTEDFLQKSKDIFYLFPLINRLPNQSWQRAHSDAVTSELWFMPLLGTLHLCLLPFLDLSHKSQGYKLLEIRSRYCSCLPQHHIWLQTWARSKSWSDPSGLFSEVGLWSLSS